MIRNWRTAGRALLGAIMVLAISPARAATTSDPLSAGALYDDLVHYTELGPQQHLTGGAADATTQAWLIDELAAAGLQTGTDAYTYYSFRPRSVALTVDNETIGSLAPFFYSGTTGPTPIEAPLVYVNLGSALDTAGKDLTGKLAVIDMPYVASINSTLASSFTNLKKTGAAGAIAVTEGPQDYPVNQDIDSRSGPQGLPTVFVGKRSGATVIAAAKAGHLGRLLLDADVGRACTTNGWAILPGRDPNRVVVIGTPTGAFVPSGSERGSGVAALLGLARHFAALPIEQRPVTFVFAVLSGHEIGYLGLPTFMQTHPDWFAHADAYVHLGASLAAVQQVELPDGSVVRTSAGDATRALYISENPLLRPGALAAFTASGAQPLGDIAPGVLDPGEQGYAYHLGVPIVASSGASYYFHTAGDTADTASPAILAAMTQGFRGAIDWIVGLPASALIAANPAAAAVGAARQPNSAPGQLTGVVGDPAYAPEPVTQCV